jgi:ankyrin repeat protein
MGNCRSTTAHHVHPLSEPELATERTQQSAPRCPGDEAGAAVASHFVGSEPMTCEATAIEVQIEGEADRDLSQMEQPGGSAVTALARLLPHDRLPDVARIWVDNQTSTDSARGGELEQQMRAATMWVLDALCNAHQDPRIKAAARQLLAVRSFCCNLDATADLCFTKLLRPGLEARLVELGGPLAADFYSTSLGVALSTTGVTAAVGQPEDHPLAGSARAAGREVPTQIDVLPCDPSDEWIDWSKPWLYPEEVYVHALLMVATALDKQFQRTVARVVAQHNASYGGGGTAAHSAAPIKAPARVMTKAKADYRYKSKPVSQHNADVTRCLVTAVTPTELLAVAAALSREFAGVVKVKNLFSATLPERAERFHLLPLMLTVETTAGGSTFATFMQQPDVRAEVDAYIADRDPGVPRHKWIETTAAALKMLESGAMAEYPVAVLGELQLMLTGHAEVRHQMHEVYKAYRAESELLLYEDYTRTEGHATDATETPASLWHAAFAGNRLEVERHLKAGAAIETVKTTVGNTALFAAVQGGYLDVVRVLLGAGAAFETVRAADGSTPLYVAVQGGHLEVVRVLIDAGAAINTAETDTSTTTPLWMAVQNGHLDILQLLVDAGATVDKVTTNGCTPLWMAAQCGHLDVVRVLVGAGAAIDTASTTTGTTPLYVAAQNGHLDVVRVLVDAGAAIDLAQTTTGITPLYKAAEKCHLHVVQALVDAGAAIDTARTTDGSTPLHMAAQIGHLEVVQALVDASADVNRRVGARSPMDLSCAGVTALGVALALGHMDVAAVLRAASAIE